MQTGHNLRFYRQGNEALSHRSSREHCLPGFTIRGIRAWLVSRRSPRSFADDTKKASPKVDRRFRRLHVRHLSAKIPRTRRWRVTKYGGNVMGTAILLREHHFPNVYSNVEH